MPTDHGKRLADLASEKGLLDDSHIGELFPAEALRATEPHEPSEKLLSSQRRGDVPTRSWQRRGRRNVRVQGAGVSRTVTAPAFLSLADSAPQERRVT